MRQMILAVATSLLLLVPLASAERTVTKDYTFVPGAVITGCGTTAVYEHCFSVRAGERLVRVDVADDHSAAVPFALIAGVPGSGGSIIGFFCGSTGGLVTIPAGATTMRVNFMVDAIAVCGSVGTTGTITLTFV